MDETMAIALITAGTGFIGALVGGFATFLGTRWAVREERAMRRDEADRAFRASLAEKHEEREVAEYGRYSAYLIERARLIARIIIAWQGGKPVGPDELDRCIAPALIFVPPEVASELAATRAKWRDLFERSSAPHGGAETSAKVNALVAEFQGLQTSADGTMEKWAARLRSGKTLLEHPALPREPLREK